MRRFVAVLITLALLIGCVFGATYHLFAQEEQSGLPPLDWAQQEVDGSSDIVTEDGDVSSVPPAEEASSEPAPEASSSESSEEQQHELPMLLQEPAFAPMDASGSGLAVQQSVSLNPEGASATANTNVDVNL